MSKDTAIIIEPKYPTKFIREIAAEYQVPMFAMVCDEHRRWITEIDPLFPYHWEMNRCDKCV